MKEFTTSNSKAKLMISLAPYKEAVNLKNVIFKEIKKNTLGLKLMQGANVQTDILEKELDFTGVVEFLKNTLIDFDISDEINSAVFRCLAGCTYNDHRITEDLFDDEVVGEDIRQDEYEIKITCIEENLRPFFKSLASMWKTLAPKIGENQTLNAILQQVNK